MTEFTSDLMVALLTVMASVVVAYYTATHTLRRETASGRARLLELCRRYVINFWNAFDDSKISIRGDSLAYQLYVGELEKIVESLDDLLGNAYVERLILKHPDVTKLLVLLRRELIEHRNNIKLTGLNAGALSEIFELVRVVRADLGRRAAATTFDIEMDELEKALRDAGIIGKV